jgi:hypothetical protein
LVFIRRTYDNLKPQIVMKSNKTPSYTLRDLDFILKYHWEYTAREMAAKLNIRIGIIWGIGYRQGIEYKRAHGWRKQETPIPESRARQRVPADLMPDPEPEKPKRVRGEYSNSGYLSTLEKYNL